MANGLTHYHTMPHFDELKIYSCGKHCEKRKKIACNKQFLLFSTVFSTPIWHLFFILTLSQTSPGFYMSAEQVF